MLQFLVGFYQSDFTFVDRPAAVAMRYVSESSPSLSWCGRATRARQACSYPAPLAAAQAVEAPLRQLLPSRS